MSTKANSRCSVSYISRRPRKSIEFGSYDSSRNGQTHMVDSHEPSSN